MLEEEEEGEEELRQCANSSDPPLQARLWRRSPCC